MAAGRPSFTRRSRIRTPPWYQESRQGGRRCLLTLAEYSYTGWSRSGALLSFPRAALTARPLARPACRACPCVPARREVGRGAGRPARAQCGDARGASVPPCNGLAREESRVWLTQRGRNVTILGVAAAPENRAPNEPGQDDSVTAVCNYQENALYAARKLGQLSLDALIGADIRDAHQFFRYGFFQRAKPAC